MLKNRVLFSLKGPQFATLTFGDGGTNKSPTVSKSQGGLFHFLFLALIKSLGTKNQFFPGKSKSGLSANNNK